MSKRAVRIGVLGTIAAVGGFVACGNQPDTGLVSTYASTSPANVSVDLRNDAGQHVGSCVGTLISASAVLTAGHCVVNAKQWVISAGGQHPQTANGARVFTTWRNFDSNWSHPQHSDVAVILLDRPMFISSYPKVAKALTTDGTRLSRVRRNDPLAADSTRFEEVSAFVYHGQEKGFPLAYTTETALMEGMVDTGGALYDAGSNTIYGVVSGKGVTSGRMYVSRVDYLAEWIDAIASCSPPPQTVQCHPTPPTCDGGGGSSSSSSGGGSSSGSGGGSSSGSGSGSGGGSSSSSGGGGDTDGGTCNPPPPPPPPPPPEEDSGTSSSGSSSGGHQCDSGTSSSSGSGGGSTSSSSSSGGGSFDGGLGDGGIITLVPDGPGCINAECGGCGNNPLCNDNQTDYGDCGCTPNPPAQKDATPIY